MLRKTFFSLLFLSFLAFNASAAHFPDTVDCPMPQKKNALLTAFSDFAESWDSRMTEAETMFLAHGYYVKKMVSTAYNPSPDNPNPPSGYYTIDDFKQEISVGKYGALLVSGHAGNIGIAVEHFQTDQAMKDRYDKLIQAGYTEAEIQPFAPETNQKEKVIAITKVFIEHYGKLAQDSIVYIETCSSFRWFNRNDDDFTNVDNVFLDANVGGVFFIGPVTEYTGSSSKNIDFVGYMLGFKSISGGIKKNHQVIDAYLALNDPILDFKTRDGDVSIDKLRLYATPKILELKIDQGNIYDYSYADQSYPYSEGDYPGDLSNCAKNPAVLDTINITVKFSEDMDTSWTGFKMQFDPQGQSAGAVPVDFNGSWSGTNTWTGSASIPQNQSSQYGGPATVIIQARDAFQVDSSSNNSNGELDTNGDGDSDGPDTQHKFFIIQLEIERLEIDSQKSYYNCSDKLLSQELGKVTGYWHGSDNVTADGKLKFSWKVETAAGQLVAEYSGVGQKSGQISGLKAGDYVFEVKAADEASNESEWVKKSFSIEAKTYKNMPCDPPGSLEHPDETYAVPTESPKEYQVEVDLNGDIAILGHGYIYEASQLLKWFDISFNIREPQSLLTSKKYPLLFIPTGGLAGLENSATFKNDLAQYVSQGGTIICFTQPHGYDFNALPGNKLTAVGYTEDTSCWQGVVPTTNHSMFSGVDKADNGPVSRITLNTDGYFIKWLPEVKVLARRYRNNLPSIVEYNYGQGRVIAMGIYSDWGFPNSQAVGPEMLVVENALKYGLDRDKEVPIITPGDALSAKCRVVFNTRQQNIGSPLLSASKVEITIKDARDFLYWKPNAIRWQKSIDLDTPLMEGNSIDIPVEITDTIGWNKGLAMISYTLYDQNGNMVQKEIKDTYFGLGEFIPTQGYSTPDIDMSFTSPKQDYMVGEKIPVTLHLWNRTAETKKIWWYYGVSAEWWGHWSTYYNQGQIEGIEIPPYQEYVATVLVGLNNIGGLNTSLVAYVYETETAPAKQIGYLQNTINIYTPSVNIEVGSDKTRYNGSDTRSLITVKINEKEGRSFIGQTKLIITGPLNNVYYSTATTVNLAIGEEKVWQIEFPLPADMAPGSYLVNGEVYNSEGMKISSNATYFELPQAQLNLTPGLPAIWYRGENTISFTVESDSLFATEGNLSCKLQDPANTVIMQNSQDLTVSSSQKTLVSMQPVIEKPVFGVYKLNYSLAYGISNITGQIELPNTNVTEITFDQPSYRIRENLGFTVKLTNNGVFEQQDLTAVIEIPNTSFSQSQGYSLSPNQSVELPVTVALPETLKSGQHKIKVTIKNGTETLQEREFSFTIADSKLAAELVEITATTSKIKISNTGGVDTQCQYNLSLIDGKGVKVYEQGETVSVRSNESAEVSFTLPQQLLDGIYQLTVKYTDTNNNVPQTWIKAIKIEGLTANLEIKTDKNIYKIEDNINGLAKLTSSGSLTAGTLNLKVSRANGSWTNYTGTNEITCILPDGNYVWFGTTNGLKRYDKSNDTWQTFADQDGVGSGGITGIVNDPYSGYIWISSKEASGSSKLTRYAHGIFKTTEIVLPGIPDIYDWVFVDRVSTGDIWLKMSKGIYFYNYYLKIPKTEFDSSSSAVIGEWLGGVDDLAVTANSVVCYVNRSYTGTGKHALYINGQAVKYFDDFLYGGEYSIEADVDNTNIWIWQSTLNLSSDILNKLYRYNITTMELVEEAAFSTPHYGSQVELKVSAASVWLISDYIEGTTKVDKISKKISKYEFSAPLPLPGEHWLAVGYRNSLDNNFALEDTDIGWLAMFGLQRYNPIADTWTQYSTRDGLIDNFVTAVAVDGQYIWCGTPRGISRFDKTAEWKKYTAENSPIIGATHAVSDGKYTWFGGQNSSMGLVRYDKMTDTFTTVSSLNRIPITTDGDYLWCLAYSYYSNDPDLDNLHRYDKVNNTWTQVPLPANAYLNDATNIAVDSQAVWLSYWGGVNYHFWKYDKSTSVWNDYTDKFGTVPNGKIFADNDFIWIFDKSAAGLKLIKFDKTTENIVTYNYPERTYVYDIIEVGDYFWLANYRDGYKLTKIAKSDGAVVEEIDSWGYFGLAYNNNSLWINGYSEYYQRALPTVYQYDLTTKTWESHVITDGLVGGVVNNIVADNQYVWFLTTLVDRWGGIGVHRYTDKGAAVWEKELAVNGAGELNFSELIGQIGDTGKYYIEATAKNTLGQELAKADNSFYVTTSNVAATFSTDKRLYKSGETINITGEVINAGLADESNVQLTLSKDSSSIFSSVYSIPAGAKVSFTASTVADKTFVLSSKTVVGTTANIAEDLIVIAEPQVEVTVTGPDTVGQDSFDLGILLKNTGQVEIVSSLEIKADSSPELVDSSKDIKLNPGESKYISQSYQIAQDTKFEIKVTGDVTKTITKVVKFGCAAQISITPAAVYPASSAGRKEIFELPVNLSNTGTKDMKLDIRYQITNTKFNLDQTKPYYIPASGGIFDNLILENVPAGEYVLSYSSQLNSGTVLLRVAEMNVVEIRQLNAESWMLNEGKIKIQATVQNVGANEFVGSIVSSLGLVDSSNKQEQRKAWEQEQDLTLAINETQTISFEIPTDNLTAGQYILGCSVLHNGSAISVKNTDLTLQPEFAITGYDDHQVFDAGSPATLKIKVKNTGPVEGQARVKLVSGDIINAEQTIWLQAAQEKELEFNFQPADDLEEKMYAAYATLAGSWGLNAESQEQQIHFYVKGYKIGVSSNFDQIAYKEGQTAKLTLTLTNEGTLEAIVYAKVNYNQYQTTSSKTTIIKGTPTTLTFEIPVQHTGQKLFYGVYHEDGRSLNLNTLYINEEKSGLTIVADKQQYAAGEQITLTLLPTETGLLNLKACGYQADTNIVTIDTQTISFTLPEEILTGTHQLNYTFTNSSATIAQGNVPLDIIGYTVKVIAASLDKSKYYPQDQIKLKLKIDSNKDIADCQFKTWLKAANSYELAGSSQTQITQGLNTIEVNTQMTLTGKGMGQVVYGLYRGELLLNGGQLAFDVEWPDTEAPVSELTVNSQEIEVGPDKYIVSPASFTITAIDYPAQHAGVDYVQYSVDNSTATKVSYQNPVEITRELEDGSHTIKYWAVDKLANTEAAKIKNFKTDNTKPQTQITINGSQVTIDGKTYITGQTEVILAALDPIVNFVCSGVKETNYRVNESTWTIYNSTITINGQGQTRIEYYSTDQLTNAERFQSQTYWIDNQPPETKLQIEGSSWEIVDKTYIGKDTKIELNSTDEGCGVKELAYKIDDSDYVVIVSTTNSYLLSANSWSEGLHTLTYKAQDQLGNSAQAKQKTLYLDITPPESSFKIVDSSYELVEGTTTYVNSHSTFTLTAVDPISNSVASGLKQMQYKVDDGEFNISLSTYTLINLSRPAGLDGQAAISDGTHAISYYSTDNVLNTEAPKAYTAIFDGTKPQVVETWPKDQAKLKASKVMAIKIKFSEPVKSADWSQDLEIIEKKAKAKQQTKNKDKTNHKKDYTINYDSTTYTVTIEGKLKNNKEYEITLKNTISDRVKNYLDQYQFSFKTLIDAKEGGQIEDSENGVKLNIPPQALPCDGYFDISIIEQSKEPKLPKPLTWLSKNRYQIILLDELDQVVQAELKLACQLTIQLKTQAITMALEQEPVEEKNLKIYQVGNINEVIAQNSSAASLSSEPSNSPQTAKLLTEQNYDPGENQISAEIVSFGQFNLAGFKAPGKSLEDLSCYPNPFNPNKQHQTIQYYLEKESSLTIAIYDLLGNLVKTWEISAGEQQARAGLNQLTWDGRNGQDDLVANGGYIVFVQTKEEKKKFKVLVVK